MALTDREQQVLDQILRGALTKEIAHSLNLSPRTVEVHRQSILRKMDARRTTDLIVKMLSREQKEMA
jgi:DNA-binding NarL/FixJ family response regulator